MSSHSSARRMHDVFSQTVLAMLLWTSILSGQVDQALCRLLGLQGFDLELLEARYGPQLAELRILRAGSNSGDAMELARLLQGNLAAQLTQGVLQRDDKKVQNASRLLSRLPLWMRDPELDQLERAARRENALFRLEQARQRRAELRTSSSAAPSARESSSSAEQRASSSAALSARQGTGTASGGGAAVSGRDPSGTGAADSGGGAAVSGRDRSGTGDVTGTGGVTPPTSTSSAGQVNDPAPSLELLADEAETMQKPPLSESFSAPEVKSDSQRSSSRSGRRKLPKAARKAANARSAGR